MRHIVGRTWSGICGWVGGGLGAGREGGREAAGGGGVVSGSGCGMLQVDL